MGEDERKEFIRKIEALRNSRVITYITTTRPNINTQMEARDLREIYRRLESDNFDESENIDLFIYSLGGESVFSWAFVNLIREFAPNFNVLIPYNAFSCATSVALGANEIIMCKTGVLGPVDPQVTNPFNPEKNGVLIPISVEDIAGFISLLKDKFELTDQNLLAKLSEILATDIRPLALGNAYRQYIKARDDARKLLELHLDPTRDKEKIDKIVETLVEKLYYHGHHVNRNEARKIGLNVTFAETINNSDFVLSNLMWDLYLDYETDLQMTTPYVDTLPTSGHLEIPIKCIESAHGSSIYVLKQDWIDLNFPSGSKLTKMNNQIGAYLPTNQFIPILPRGQVLQMGDRIYEKRETTIWK